MKRLVLVVILVLLIKPVFAFSYASELTNGNETFDLITNISYEGKDYLLYETYQDNQTKLTVLQDSLDNLITDNQTIKDVFYTYRLGILEASKNETVENPRIASEEEFNLFVNRIQEKKDIVTGKISDVENLTPQYQSLILNLSSQGAYASKSIKLFSDLQDMIWQSKMLLFQSKFNSADKMIEDAKKLALQITLDVRFSFRVNEGSIALEKVLASINDAGKQGYNITEIENEFDRANSLLTEAKNDYINGNYDGIDSNIDSVLKTSDNISQEIENLKAINHQASENVSTLEPTGLVIKDYSWISYIVGIAIIMVAVFLVFRRKSSKFSYHYKRRLF